jgi:hypothetical protein
MDHKIAFEILEIDLSETNYKDINIEYLKKQYHRQALKNHPDKNGNTQQSKEKFQKINEAYDFLKREENINIDNCFEDDTINTNGYVDILQMFLLEIFKGTYNDLFFKIIKDIVLKKFSLKVFNDLDKDTSFQIYNFLSKHKNILHISQEILDEIRNIVHKKCNDIIIYKLNPSMDDLFENNVYKLYIDNKLYLVPLWHNELYFDSFKLDKPEEIVVLCEPDLPQHIIIDENNNLCINITVSINDLQDFIVNNKKIQFCVGKKEFEIPVDKLYIKQEQTYRIRKQGLSKINEYDMYDISEKGDIIVNIIMK